MCQGCFYISTDCSNLIMSHIWSLKWIILNGKYPHSNEDLQKHYFGGYAYRICYCFLQIHHIPLPLLHMLAVLL